MFVLAKSFQLTEFARNQWFVELDHGVNPPDVLKPDFWKNVAGLVKPYDKITYVGFEGKFYGELIILAVGHNWLKVGQTTYTEFPAESKPVIAQEEFKVKYRGPARRYGVFRLSDGAMLKDGFIDETEAYTYIKDYCQAIAA